MKIIWILLAVNIPALVCLSAAIMLAMYEKPGWEWFLVFAAITVHGWSLEKKDES